MKPTPRQLGLVLCGWLLWAAGGCADITVRNPPPEPAAQPAQPAQDGRPAERISQDNAALRAALAGLEQRHGRVVADVEARQRQKDTLKRQREQVEDDRDRYKKRLKKDD